MDIETDRELAKAMMEQKRAENLIKYKDEIMNRPKRHWIMNGKEKLEVKEKAKNDIQNVNARFEDQLNS